MVAADARDAKVADFDFLLDQVLDQYVLQLEVAVDYVLEVAVVDRVQHLFEKDLGVLLRESVLWLRLDVLVEVPLEITKFVFGDEESFLDATWRCNLYLLPRDTP